MGGSFGQLLESCSSALTREFKSQSCLCQPGNTEPLSQVVAFLTDQGHALGFHIKKIQDKWLFSSFLNSIPENLSPLSNGGTFTWEGMLQFLIVLYILATKVGIVEANRTLNVNFEKLDCSSGSVLPSHKERFACFSFSFFFPFPSLPAGHSLHFTGRPEGFFYLLTVSDLFSSKMGTLHVLPPE